MTKKLLLTLFVLGCVSGAGPACAAERRPNFVFILVDDLGYMDIGANHPETFYETPNIDRLAAQGMRFTDGYAASPVCSPTRASILTGKYPPRSGITDYIHPAAMNQPQNWRRDTRLLPAPYTDRLVHEEVTLAEALKEAGYATFFAGKWHLGPEGFWPEDQGFDVNKGGCERGGPRSYFSPYHNPRLADGPNGEHLPDRLASETAAFIAAHQDQPFLAFLSFYSVHTPLTTREDLKRKYEAKAKSIRSDRPRWGQEGVHKVRLVQDHAVYAGMVEAMDQAVGKVLDKLDELGLERDTVVFFTSDNGGLSTAEGHPTSNLPLRAGKGWLYEGGIRVPLVIKWPGFAPPGSTSAAAVTSTDFYPTVAEMAGLAALESPPRDGVSLVTLLQSGGGLDREALYWHYPHYGNQGGAPGGAIRSGRWKLIEWYEDGRLELFDLKNDVGEQFNLAAKSLETVRVLRQKLVSWRTQVGARLPTPNRAEPQRR